MINMSECFCMIGKDECIDVATSLGMQGINNSMPEISIPIYGQFFMKILRGQEYEIICDNMQQFGAINDLNINCGTVAFTINLCRIDVLTLACGVLTSTPSTGMNCFLRLCTVDIENITHDILIALAAEAGTLIPNGIIEGVQDGTEFAVGILETFSENLSNAIYTDLGANNIGIQEYDNIWNFYMNVKDSDEMYFMRKHRELTGALVL